ncbi:MAG: 50S ribosomal protein L6 [Candidatus Woesearchaeota archaeon]
MAKFEKKTELPNGITATISEGIMTVKGPKGEVAKKMKDPMIKIKIEGNTIIISAANDSKRQKRVINTFAAHIKNMIAGVQKPYQYRLKICSGHFPMNVTIQGDTMIVKNFLGEKSPRTLKLKKGATVKVEGDQISVESCDKDLAGQQASDIELLTAKRNRDLRVFQDGIYITEKAGNKLFEA